MSNEKIIGQWFDPLGYGHILKRHPDMVFMIEDVGETIVQPDLIITNWETRLFYREISDRNGIYFLKVVVKSDANYNYVATAFRVLGIQQDGVVEWQTK